MKKREISPLTLRDVQRFRTEHGNRFFSATHDEILQGYTSDIYFVRTMDVLRSIGKANTPVCGEIFAREDGIFCGLEEVKHLLKDRGIALWSLHEGDTFANREVVMRLEAPYEAFGIYETAILGFLASSSAWCTNAKQCKEAANGKPVISFGARHIHPAVAPVMERSAVLGGCDGTSSVLGAALAGKTPSGTMPHAFILILGDTMKAAEAYLKHLPEEPQVVLVDTFKDEAEETLRVAVALGKNLHGVRLDTPSERGRVTPELVTEVRTRLDLAGFRHVKIFVSGGLTPDRITTLSNAGADAFGVGAYISSASPIDMTLDLKEVDGKPIAKRGRLPGKTRNPRLHRAW